MMDSPLVSIVIPTLNSEKTLGACLLSVGDQTYPNIEIVVVDGGSDDGTVDIASASGAQVINANIQSMTKQTNIGINRSKGKYLYRVDSDVILDPDIVESSVNKCENELYDGVCIFWLPDESISFWAKVRKIEKESYIEHPNYVGATKYNKNVLGARFLRRDVLETIGGFDEEIPTLGEDYALYNKLAKSDFNFAIIDSRERHIGEPRKIRDIIRKNFRYGTALTAFLEEQEGGLRQFAPTGRTYLKNAFKRAFKQDLKLFFGLSVYIFTVYASTGTGMVYYRITKKTKRLA
jgi:glycosyltransferase involved in cell wall biosynthesis